MSENPQGSAAQGQHRQPTIEQCLQRLKKISADLQAEDINMDEALRLYKEGAKIANEADKLLDKYEAEIRVIEMGTTRE